MLIGNGLNDNLVIFCYQYFLSERVFLIKFLIFAEPIGFINVNLLFGWMDFDQISWLRFASDKNGLHLSKALFSKCDIFFGYFFLNAIYFLGTFF